MKTVHLIKNGLQAALPIMIGYIPLALTFGIAGIAAGLLPLQVLMISALIFAGASQFLLLASVQSGMAWSWVVMLCALLDVRHLLYGPLLSALLPPRLQTRLLLAFSLTDEVFSTALNRLPHVEEGRGAWMAGLGSGAWISWVGGTALGAYAGGRFTLNFPFLTQVLAFALPALFLTLAIQSANAASRASAIVAAIVAGALVWAGHSSLAILIGAFAGCAFYRLRHRKA
jgi:4-azaleucine resistance transporter AzlC